MSQRAFSSHEHQGMLAAVAKVALASGGYEWSTARFAAHKAHELSLAPPQSRYWSKRKTLEYLPLKMMFGGVALLPLIIALSDRGYPKLLGMIGFLAVGLVLLGGILSSFTLRGPAQWLTIPLDDYNWGSIPEEAKQIIFRIRDSLPGTRFVVHELRQDSLPLDPGLEAIGPCGDSCIFYVWKDDQVIHPH